ncbi:MAG: SCO family protein [Dehalococcoidia bacterium]
MKRPPILLALLWIVALAAACGQDEPSLPGFVLEPDDAPPIELSDSTGRPVSLADYRGRPVVISFLYTDCPDVCPVIGQRIGQALETLDEKSEDVAVLIVSVDPAGDTPEKAQSFMEKHHLAGTGRHYLLGDAETLAPIWLAYGVGTAPLNGAQQQTGGAAQFGRIGHTDATFLIDREGKKRTLLRGDATAEDIARGLRILLR